MKNELVKLDAPELSVIEESKAKQIRATFEPMVEMLEKFEESFTEILNQSKKKITPDLIARAKRLRLDVGKVRIETDKLRKSQKEQCLREGQAIDGVSNILKWAVSEKEDKLKEIEDHFEIEEAKRLEKLQADRAEKLSIYVEDAFERDLSKLQEDEFEALLSMKKRQHEERLAAEKKAEEDRIAKEKAEAAERERIRLENEKLKKEAEKRDREEAERIKREAAERKAREEAEEKERKIREEKARKEREEYEAKLKAERDEKERIEAELKAKAEAERKAREDEAARIEAELKKGDVDKVKDLVNDLELLKSKYVFKAEKNRRMYSDVGVLIDKIVDHISRF